MSSWKNYAQGRKRWKNCSTGKWVWCQWANNILLDGVKIEQFQPELLLGFALICIKKVGIRVGKQKSRLLMRWPAFLKYSIMAEAYRSRTYRRRLRRPLVLKTRHHTGGKTLPQKRCTLWKDELQGQSPPIFYFTFTYRPFLVFKVKYKVGYLLGIYFPIKSFIGYLFNPYPWLSGVNIQLLKRKGDNCLLSWPLFFIS